MRPPQLLAVADLPMRGATGMAVQGGSVFASVAGGLALAQAPVRSAGVGPWRTWDVRGIAGVPRDLTRCDGLAATYSGVVIAGGEPTFVAHVDPLRERVLASTVLHSTDGKPGPLGKLGTFWRTEENPGVVGVLPLTGQRVLALQSHQPAALVLFGPAGGATAVEGVDLGGDTDQGWPGALHALRWWLLPATVAGPTGVALAPGGRLAVLADRGRGMYLLDLALSSGREAEIRDHVLLPDGVGRVRAMTWAAPDTLLVACDTGSANDALVTLSWG